ncbi:hypothetical protein EDC30_104277 [Paucimonas lemoignei]|uniref:HK97 gp10 family phage protein n=1 Tax=Paucimonas lemoignei TaxID=29443 RepID=A0A4R3HXW8_PAULE|nr:hypothetical protein [Paucimonas lemoignei]TCS37473.1 hypothetical protein EDC30_104277 [Paucimonas lemoignei]
MMSMSVKSNVDAVRKNLTDIAKKQLPFAVAKGLTATAKDTQGVLTEALPRQLDRPTPFTMRAFAITPATKSKLYAKVFVKPDQWKYLTYQFEGGDRKPTGRALVLPKNVKLNQFGNMQRRAIKQLLAKKNVFSGVVDGVPGIYLRKQFASGTGVQLLVGYADQVRYRKRYPFQAIAQRSVSKAFDRNFKRALDEALASAR